jgi:hypothetical protein
LLSNGSARAPYDAAYIPEPDVSGTDLVTFFVGVLKTLMGPDESESFRGNYKEVGFTVASINDAPILTTEPSGLLAVPMRKPNAPVDAGFAPVVVKGTDAEGSVMTIELIRGGVGIRGTIFTSLTVASSAKLDLLSGMPSGAGAGNATNLTIPSGGNVTLYYSPPPLKRGTPLEKLRFRLVDNATEYNRSDAVEVDVNVLCSPGRGCTSCMQLTHSLKAPGFNPCAYYE